jgi:hypothetical protein
VLGREEAPEGEVPVAKLKQEIASVTVCVSISSIAKSYSAAIDIAE